MKVLKRILLRVGHGLTKHPITRIKQYGMYGKCSCGKTIDLTKYYIPY